MHTREWWQATDEEVSAIATELNFAKKLANERDDTIGLTDEMPCRPLDLCKASVVMEIVRPDSFYFTDRLRSPYETAYKDRVVPDWLWGDAE